MAFPAAPNRRKTGNPQRAGSISSEKLLAGKEPLIQELSRDYDLRLYRFGTALEPIAPASISQLKAQDQGTRLLEVLQSAAREAGEQSGILLFSDGIANGDRKTWKKLSPCPCPSLPSAWAIPRASPTFASPISGPGVRFPRTRVETRFDGSGLRSQRQDIPLYFNRGKNLITSRSISVNADPFEQKSPSALRQKKSALTAFRLPFQINRESRLPKTTTRILRSTCNAIRFVCSLCPALPLGTIDFCAWR